MTQMANMDYSLVEKLREQQIKEGFAFPLSVTFAGFEDVYHAQVRRVNIMETAAFKQLPTDVQTEVFDGVGELRKESARSGDREPNSVAEMLAQNEKVVRAATIWCRAAFIHPRLVEKREDVSDPIKQWPVDVIAVEDRIRLFMWSMNNDPELLSNIKLFRPEWRPDAEDNASVPTTDEAERPLDVALFRRDA